MNELHGRSRLLTIVAVGVVIMAGSPPQAPAAAAGATRWYWQNPFPRGGLVGSIACPGRTTCVAVGAAGRIVTTEDGGKHWTERQSGTDGFLSSVACPSRRICYALAGSVSVVNQQVAGTQIALGSGDGGHTWRTLSPHLPASSHQGLSAIACPSVSVCIAVGGGNADEPSPIVVTRDGGRTWQSRDLDASGDFLVVTCPSSAVCYAANIYGQVVATSDGGRSWQPRHPFISSGNSRVTSFSCPTVTTCYLLGWGSDEDDTWSDIYATTNGARSWRHAEHFPDQVLQSIACPTVKRCYAIGSGIGFGTIAVTTTAWHRWSTHTLQQEGGPMACPGVQVCYATAQYAVLKTTNGWRTWVETLAHSRLKLPVQTIACPDVSTCYAAGTGLAATKDGGAIWKEQASGKVVPLERVACSSVAVCYAIGTDFENSATLILRTTDGGVTWYPLTSPPGAVDLRDISCLAPNICYIAAALGLPSGPSAGLLLTRDGGATWTVQESLGPAIRGGATASATPESIVCPSTVTCYVTATSGFADQAAPVLVVTRDGGATWERHDLPLSPVVSGVGLPLACPGADTCYLATSSANGQVFLAVTHDAWRTVQTSAIPGLKGQYGTRVADIACPAIDTCTIVGALGGIFGTEDGGATWQRQEGSPPDFMSSIACPAVGDCYAVGDIEIVATHLQTPRVAAVTEPRW